MSDPEVNPLTPDTNPTTININSKLLLVVAKSVIGLILLIVSLCVQDYYTIGGYLVLIFIGSYLICDAAISVIPDADFILKINDRNIEMKFNKTKTKLCCLVILSIIWFILELALGPRWYWPAGSVIGFILSIISLISSVTALLTTQFKMGINFRQQETEYNAINSGGFMLYENLGNTLKTGWIGFTSTEVLKKKIYQKRFLYYFLTAIIVALSVLVVIQEFLIIRNWSCKEYADRWLDGGLGWGVVSCTCQYWAGGSAAGTIVFLSLFIGAVLKPSWPTTLIAGALTLGFGVYMALLSTSTVQSLMFMGNFTHNEHPDLILDPVTNRFLHLIPIQYIALIMITLGFAFPLHCFGLKQQDDRTMLKKVLTKLLLVGIIVLTVVNMTATQVSVTEQLWKYYKEPECDYCSSLDWPVRNIYLMYIVSTLSLSMLMLGSSVMKLIHLNVRIPGALTWLNCLCHLGLAIFCIYTTCHDPGYVRYEHLPELIILKDTPLWVLVLNFTTIFISGLFGILGLFIYGIEVLQTFYWICAALIFPFVFLWSLYRNQVEAERIKKNEDHLSSADYQAAAATVDEEQTVALVNETE